MQTAHDYFWWTQDWLSVKEIRTRKTERMNDLIKEELLTLMGILVKVEMQESEAHTHIMIINTCSSSPHLTRPHGDVQNGCMYTAIMRERKMYVKRKKNTIQTQALISYFTLFTLEGKYCANTYIGPTFTDLNIKYRHNHRSNVVILGRATTNIWQLATFYGEKTWQRFTYTGDFYQRRR